MRAKAGVDFDPKTHADSIRGLSDEDLAAFIAGICAARDAQIQECLNNAGYIGTAIIFDTLQELPASRLDWLQSPINGPSGHKPHA